MGVSLIPGLSLALILALSTGAAWAEQDTADLGSTSVMAIIVNHAKSVLSKVNPAEYGSNVMRYRQ
jgi:hypothetical protein